ncbi:hypothetical protein ABZ915_43750 [Streptomyces sp. NPDC046915]|uniref:WD40 repeat domain-containing protein n=1 Tax=Streptomyces sp. NPDC046915 TaxID=3155257 RepID=UPI003405C9EE
MAFGSKGHTLITYEQRAEGKDGYTGTAQDDGIRARIWDIADPSRPRPAGTGILLEKELDVADLTPSADGRMLATSDGADGIHLWDMSNPTHPVRRGRTLHGSAVAFAPNGHYLAVGSQEGTIRLWDITRPPRPQPLGTPFQADGSVDGAAVSPDSRSLAIRTSEGEIQLWDTGDPLRPSGRGHSFAGQASFVDSLLFSPDSQTLATGAEQGAVRIWILDAGRAIRHICAINRSCSDEDRVEAVRCRTALPPAVSLMRRRRNETGLIAFNGSINGSLGSGGSPSGPSALPHPAL